MKPKRAPKLFGCVVLAMLATACPPLPPSVPQRECTRLAEQLFTFGSALDNPTGVVAAKVENCHVQLLGECKTGATYGAPSTSPQLLPRVLIADKEEARGSLPLDVEAFAAELEDAPGQRLVRAEVESEVQAAVPPLVRSAGSGMQQSPGLVGQCSLATHYVDRLYRGSLNIDGGSQPITKAGVIAFTLKPLRAGCPDGSRWDGSACRTLPVVDSCPLGTQASKAEGCEARPIPWPAETPQVAELKEALQSKDAARRITAFARLLAIVGKDDKHGRAIVLARLTNDEGILASCHDAAADARLVPSRPANLLGQLVRLDRAPQCDAVAQMLVSYSELLDEANQSEAAAEVNLRLVREHPKSVSSAPAFRKAAEKLCRDGDVSGANRLYLYIREKFAGTATASSLPTQCFPPSSEMSQQKGPAAD